MLVFTKVINSSIENFLYEEKHEKWIYRMIYQNICKIMPVISRDLKLRLKPFCFKLTKEFGF